MKTTLNMVQRFHLLEALPKQNNLALARIMTGLINKLGPSDKEHTEFGIFYLPNGSIQLGKEKDSKGNDIVNQEKLKNALEEREIDFGEKETDIIKLSLKRVDKEKKVTTALIPLFDKFLGVDYNGEN